MPHCFRVCLCANERSTGTRKTSQLSNRSSPATLKTTNFQLFSSLLSNGRIILANSLGSRIINLLPVGLPWWKALSFCFRGFHWIPGQWSFMCCEVQPKKKKKKEKKKWICYQEFSGNESSKVILALSLPPTWTFQKIPPKGSHGAGQACGVKLPEEVLWGKQAAESESRSEFFLCYLCWVVWEQRLNCFLPHSPWQ